MATPQPPLGGPLTPPTFALPQQLPKPSGSKWSMLGSSLVIFAFSLRLLGDKYEHQARHRAAALRRGASGSADAVAPHRTRRCVSRAQAEQVALKAELDAARADAASLRAELDAAYASGKKRPPPAAPAAPAAPKAAAPPPPKAAEAAKKTLV